MLKRDKVKLEIKELNSKYWDAGTITKELYTSELKRLRFRWLTEYEPREWTNV
jgi:hypothetical protein